MNYKKCFAAMAFVAFVVYFVLGIVFIEIDNLKTGIDLTLTSVSTEATTQFVAEIQDDNQASEEGLSEEPEQENEPIATETPTDIQIAVTSDEATQSEYFAEITIKTYEKTGTYRVMSDVNEKTMKENIGWLPSSSLPGEDGLCILMGHRDTDFRILQYLKTGDEIIVEKQNSKFFYKVGNIEIVNRDTELRFYALSNACLELVTCYPFCYSGHAPKKLVIHASIF